MAQCHAQATDAEQLAETQRQLAEAELYARAAEAELMSMLDGEHENSVRKSLGPQQNGPLSKAQKKRLRQKHRGQQQGIIVLQSEPHSVQSQSEPRPQPQPKPQQPHHASRAAQHHSSMVCSVVNAAEHGSVDVTDIPITQTDDKEEICSKELTFAATIASAASQPPRPIVELSRAEVLRWVNSVDELTSAQRAAASAELAEDEYDGQQLAAATALTLRRLLKGTAAAEAVTLLLAARDAANSAATAARVVPSSHVDWASSGGTPNGAGRPTCPVCLELYCRLAEVVPRVLVACGHSVCGGCLDQMLSRTSRMKCGKSLDKRLECPICRKECRVKRGEACSLPINYTALGV